MEGIHIIIFFSILLISYMIFFKKDTFINRKLENFNGDDLNIHKYDDLNVANDDNHDDNQSN